MFVHGFGCKTAEMVPKCSQGGLLCGKEDDVLVQDW